MFILFPSLPFHRYPACFKCWPLCSEHWFYSFEWSSQLLESCWQKWCSGTCKFLSRLPYILPLVLPTKIFWALLPKVSFPVQSGVWPHHLWLSFCSWSLPFQLGSGWIAVSEHQKARGGAAQEFVGLSIFPTLISPLTGLRMSFSSWFLHTRVWTKPAHCVWYALCSFNSRTALLPPVLFSLNYCFVEEASRLSYRMSYILDLTESFLFKHFLLIPVFL